MCGFARSFWPMPSSFPSALPRPERNTASGVERPRVAGSY